MLTSANTPDAGATIECKIQVNGVDAPGTLLTAPANAAGIAQGETQINFDTQGGNLPAALCERKTWGDGDTSGWVCRATADVDIPRNRSSTCSTRFSTRSMTCRPARLTR
ncbi:MAG: hypothetical protein QOG34_540 [Frankiaceae bacterium]|nr:hypothetical protein [Frankiaceae bacterium]